MNFFNYMESRFVSSQIELSKKHTTGELARNQAIRALLWISLKVATAFYIVATLIHFLAASIGLIAKPRPALQVATDHSVSMEKEKAEKEKAVKSTLSSVSGGALKS